VEIKTEADSNDIAECPHDDKPTTGMFGLLVLYSLHSFVCIRTGNPGIPDCVESTHVKKK